jgi:hypothetical protein
MSVHVVPRRLSLAAAAMLLIAIAAPPERADAQRRPGVSTNFYTTTGLLTADLEVGSVRSTTPLAETPSLMASLVVTIPLVKSTRRAWIAGARAPMLWVGNGENCYAPSPTQGCQNRRFSELVAVHTGGAFDIRSTVLRVMVGPALYQVEKSGTRVGTQLHLDLAAPRLRGATPTFFFSRSFLGSQGGEAVGISSLGVGLRWVKKT